MPRLRPLTLSACLAVCTALGLSAGCADDDFGQDRPPSDIGAQVTQDLHGADLATPDLAGADLATLDMTVTVVDMATPDMAMPDLTVVDLTPP